MCVEVGSDVGITIVTPGVVESSITNDEWLLKTNLYWSPMMSTEDCATVILDSIRRGDEYLTEPPWMRVFFMWNAVCPEMLKWTTRFLFITCSKGSLENREHASKAALISFFETLRVEVGSDIGITIVTPGVVKSEITNDQWLLKTNLKWTPMMATENCAKAILDSIRRGDEYLTEPPWVRVLFWSKTLCPEILKWSTRFIFITCSKGSPENKTPHLLK
ncbi:hypothetical protein L2E82_16079 [Cichorium intybus]|uniref:Uncharacterized protein n=1 Tax=Cichorium intybus TaxID=13427 RepID=A0ACB9F5Q5_CICIN|nr:hypothetical protein L2E82_16079 [Cichorium intybus]